MMHQASDIADESPLLAQARFAGLTIDQQTQDRRQSAEFDDEDDPLSS
jgi:hypothetical protein